MRVIRSRRKTKRARRTKKHHGRNNTLLPGELGCHRLAGSLARGEPGSAGEEGKTPQAKKRGKPLNTFANLQTHGLTECTGSRGAWGWRRGGDNSPGEKSLANRLIHSQICKLTDSRTHGIHAMGSEKRSTATMSKVDFCGGFKR